MTDEKNRSGAIVGSKIRQSRAKQDQIDGVWQPTN